VTGVLVYASRRALEEAERLVPGRVLECAIEEAIRQGRKRAHSLPALQVELGSGERFVLIDSTVAAIVAKAGRTPGGRHVFRALRLVRLRPRAPR
jgi:hypothetical protein